LKREQTKAKKKQKISRKTCAEMIRRRQKGQGSHQIIIRGQGKSDGPFEKKREKKKSRGAGVWKEGARGERERFAHGGVGEEKMKQRNIRPATGGG